MYKIPQKVFEHFGILQTYWGWGIAHLTCPPQLVKCGTLVMVEFHLSICLWFLYTSAHGQNLCTSHIGYSHETSQMDIISSGWYVANKHYNSCFFGGFLSCSPFVKIVDSMRYHHEISVKSHQDDVSAWLDDMSLSRKKILAHLILELSSLAKISCNLDFGHFLVISC